MYQELIIDLKLTCIWLQKTLDGELASIHLKQQYYGTTF